MSRIIEKFKMFSVRGELLESEMNDWFEKNPNAVLCDIKYGAGEEWSKALVMYVVDPERAAKLPADIQVTELVSPVSEDEDIEEIVNKWRSEHQDRMLVNVQYVLEEKEDYILIVHACQPMYANTEVK